MILIYLINIFINVLKLVTTNYKRSQVCLIYVVYSIDSIEVSKKIRG